ncbi:nitroreductase family protein [Gluconacetobacter sacchari]|uniref:Nitroreductase family protein n=2 Tax=Gluconacetobacter sacchari TaxID=92759 RepID=A0A7W4IFJ3_9PROT|nr:nitroreductase family protein [Gluconacetobacter sacchari]MBB2161872.1 nitroreductase family protein [Gluconacetobacter sacchari]GBQ19279.1 NADH/NADPH-flavin oxidoreductase [Gluconacetobacter sacchari DSM 12717]
MNEILDTMHARRAVKHFDAGHEMPGETLAAILHAARTAPTAFNIQNWRFLVVRDPAVRAAIKAVAWNQPQIEECSALIVLCADMHAYAKDPGRYWKDAPEAMREKYVSMITQYYENNPAMQRDEAFRSAGMAAYALMMAAAAFGYDTCPMDGFDFEQVAEIVRLPRDHALVMFVAIGKGMGDLPPHGGRIADADIIAYDRF